MNCVLLTTIQSSALPLVCSYITDCIHWVTPLLFLSSSVSTSPQNSSMVNYEKWPLIASLNSSDVSRGFTVFPVRFTTYIGDWLGMSTLRLLLTLTLLSLPLISQSSSCNTHVSEIIPCSSSSGLSLCTEKIMAYLQTFLTSHPQSIDQRVFTLHNQAVCTQLAGSFHRCEDFVLIREW